MNLWALLAKDLLHISTRNYLDWTSVVLYGFLPTTWFHALLAFFAHLLWAGSLGVAFAFLLVKLKSQGIRFKGALFGYFVGFILFGIAILLRMPFFTKIPFPTSASNAIGGILWGVTTAHVLNYFNVKYKQ